MQRAGGRLLILKYAQLSVCVWHAANSLLHPGRFVYMFSALKYQIMGKARVS